MQTRSRQYAVVASVALTTVLAACSSSTSPKPQITPAQLAEHFDSIYSADLAGGTHNDSNAAGIVADYAELAPANGGGEVSFTATTASGQQAWHGVGYALIENSGADTVYYALMYQNRNLQPALIMGHVVGADTGSLVVGSADGFVTFGDDSVGTVAVSTVSTASTCVLQSGLAAASVMTEYVGSGSSCTSGKFQWSFDVTFPAADGFGAMESVSATNVTISGPIFGPTGGSHVVTIPSKSAAAADRLLALIGRRH